MIFHQVLKEFISFLAAITLAHGVRFYVLTNCHNTKIDDIPLYAIQPCLQGFEKIEYKMFSPAQGLIHPDTNNQEFLRLISCALDDFYLIFLYAL